MVIDYLRKYKWYRKLHSYAWYRVYIDTWYGTEEYWLCSEDDTSFPEHDGLFGDTWGSSRTIGFPSKYIEFRNKNNIPTEDYRFKGFKKF